MLGIKIELEEIDNGYLVKFFSEHGKSKFDKILHFKTFEEALEEVSNWRKKVRE